MILKFSQIPVFSNIELLKNAGYIKKDLDPKILDQYYNTCMSGIGSILDRTGTIEPLIQTSIHKYDPIPDFDPTFNKKFGQICIERAKELLGTGKRLNVFWSGGIDSTIVLLSLLSELKDPKQVRVIATHTSIIESGPLFDTHIKGRCDVLLRSSTTKEYFYSNTSFDLGNELFVTGECADQLVIQTFKTPIDKSVYFLPWQEVVDSGRSCVDADKIEFIKPSFEKSPRPLITYRDLLWYYKFNLQWAHSRYSSFIGTDPRYHPIVFFNTNDFQQWSIHDKEEMEDPYVQKYSYKKFIYELTKNKEYSFGKPKTASSAWILPNFKNELFLLEDKTTKTILDIYKELLK